MNDREMTFDDKMYKRGYDDGSKSKQAELDKANAEVEHYLSAYRLAHKQAMDNGSARDKANARIAQLEDVCAKAYSHSVCAGSYAASRILEDISNSASIWLSEHDKAVEVKVLEEAAKHFDDSATGKNYITNLICMELRRLAESRK